MRIEPATEPARAPLAATAKGADGVILPPFRTLALIASGVAGLAALAALVAGPAANALSIVGGLAIALLMYAGIHSFVSGASRMVVGAVGGRADADARRFMPQFALATIGKFVVLGFALFAMVRWLHVNLLYWAAGFFVSQIVITAMCVRALIARPLITR